MISSSPRSVIKKCISCLLSLTHTSRFTHSRIVPDLLWVLSIFQTVLGFFNWSFPILSLFRSLLLIKLSVAPESTRTCLSVVECEDFKRVGIRSDLNLLANTIFDSTLRRHAQTDRVAILKICFRTNFHPSLGCYSPIDDSDLLFFCEGLTFTNPGIISGLP